MNKAEDFLENYSNKRSNSFPQSGNEFDRENSYLNTSHDDVGGSRMKMQDWIKEFGQKLLTLDGKALSVLGAAIVLLVVIMLWMFPVPRYTLQVKNSNISHKLDRWTGKVYVVSNHEERLIENKENKKHRSVRNLTDEELRRLKGRGGPDDYYKNFKGSLYNGNEKVAITELKLFIKSHKTCDDWGDVHHDKNECEYCLSPDEKFSQYCVAEFSYPLKPYETSSFSASILWGSVVETRTQGYNTKISNDFAWNIVSAKGYDVND